MSVQLLVLLILVWLCHDWVFSVTVSTRVHLFDCYIFTLWLYMHLFDCYMYIYTVTMHLFDCYIFTLWLCHNLMFSVDVSRKLHLYDCITYIYTPWLRLNVLSRCISEVAFVCYLFALWLCHNWMFSIDVSIRVYVSMLPVCTVTMSHLNVLCRCINQGVLVHVTCLCCDYVTVECSL